MPAPALLVGTSPSLVEGCLVGLGGEWKLDELSASALAVGGVPSIMIFEGNIYATPLT